MTTLKKVKFEDMQLAIDSHHGVYVPQFFVQQFDKYRISNIRKDVLDSLLNGPDDEFYWESWDVYLNSTFKDDNNVKHYIFQNEDLWFIPLGFNLPDEWFI